MKSSNVHHIYRGGLKGSSEHSFKTSLNEVFNHIFSTQVVCESLKFARTFNNCPFLTLVLNRGHESVLYFLSDASCPYTLGCKRMFIFSLYTSTTNNMVLHFAFH